jgi:hypothetical protein
MPHPRVAGARASLFGAEGPRRTSVAGEDHRGGRKPRFRPLLLSKILGPRPLTPPPAGLAPPRALARLAALRPSRDRRGVALADVPASLALLEEIDPATLRRDRRRGAHWDAEQWHAGAARGLLIQGAWAWLYREGERWWAVSAEGPLARHDGVWWLKEGNFWFVVHDGQPWAWRPFHEWDAEGLFQPGTATEMVYSRDFKRVAVISPGEGAEVFDAADGRLLETIPEARMPPRRRPKAPEFLSLPKDSFAQ